MAKYKVTFTDGHSQEILADNIVQDPRWTSFFNKVEKKGESDVMVGSFQSGYILSVVNMDIK